MKIELSKDEIETIYWAVSCLIYDIKEDPFNYFDVTEKDLTDLKNVENKFDKFLEAEDDPLN